MTRSSWLRGLGLSAILLITASGCGGSATPVSTSNTEATVSGTVAIKGKPATSGEVSFDPSNIKRPMEPPRSAKIGEDGSYTITTLVGDNQVRVNTPETQTDRELSGTDLIFEVKEGSNQFDITLPTSRP